MGEGTDKVLDQLLLEARLTISLSPGKFLGGDLEDTAYAPARICSEEPAVGPRTRKGAGFVLSAFTRALAAKLKGVSLHYNPAPLPREALTSLLQPGSLVQRREAQRSRQACSAAG